MINHFKKKIYLYYIPSLSKNIMRRRKVNAGLILEVGHVTVSYFSSLFVISIITIFIRLSKILLS